MKYLQMLLAICFGAILLLNPAQAVAKKTYGGADAGYLVYSVGTLGRPMNFNFLYRRIPSDDKLKWKGSMNCWCLGAGAWNYPKNIDYKGHESGYVRVEKLPPGQYEFYNYGIAGTNIVSTINWSAKVNFSIPFTIQPGQATYIGNFARGCWCERSTRIEDYLGYFVISDKSERDLDIARRKELELPLPTAQVFDATKLSSPIFFTAEPQ